MNNLQNKLAYEMGWLPPNYPVPVPMPTAIYMHNNWCWVITALARMRIKLHHELNSIRPPDGIGKGKMKRWYRHNLGKLPVNWREKPPIPKRRGE